MSSFRRILLGLCLAYLQVPNVLEAAPLDSAFTYQGQLKSGGIPANGTFNFQFAIWDAPTGGTQFGASTIVDGLSVRNGLFTVTLNVDVAVFDGNARWLQVTVDGTPLVPRQPILAVPYALQTRGMFVNSAMDVGIGISAPTKKLEVAGDGKFTGGDITAWNGDKALSLRQDGNNSYLSNKSNFAGNGSEANGALILNGQSGVQLKYGNTGGSGTLGLTLTSSGNVGIGVSDPGSKVVINASDNQLLLRNPNATKAAAFVFNTQAGDPQEGGITLQRRNPDGTWAADSAVLMTINVKDGTVTVPVLQITGGADIAEPFVVSKPEGAVLIPGMVVVIDPEHPGHLRLAEVPYDQKAAGVISGANGINPGLILKQERSSATGDHAVALTGRVWCWCDASTAPIVPGDLLTTSGTPGHAMKVADHSRAQGAILGKAMTSLEDGKGLVLVLVSLQ